MLIFKIIEYFFPKIDENFERESLKILSDKEKKIFSSMGSYDRMHSLEVYKKVLDTELKRDKKYTKLALLHDCGKGNAGIIKRILHKFKFNTILREHPEMGYIRTRELDEELAILIKNHHNRNYGDKMRIFQKCDDGS